MLENTGPERLADKLLLASLRAADHQGDDPPPVYVRPDRFRVCHLPQGHAAERYFTIYVRAVGDRWVVSNGFQPEDRVDADGAWTDSWGENPEATLHDFVTAMTLAMRVAPDVEVNGATAAQVLAGAWPRPRH